MALTKVSRGLLSTGIVDNSNATAITIDSSENVGIGVTNPSDYYAENLVVAAADEGGITIESATTEKAYLMFADGTSGDAAYRGYLGYDHGNDSFNVFTSNYINFYTGDTGGNAERMRIDSSGQLSLATTEDKARMTIGLTGVAVAGDTDGATMGENAIVHLLDSNSTATNSTVMLLGGGGGATGQIKSGIGFSRESAANWGTQLRFYTHSTPTSDLDELKERMRIDSSGNLLLGTTSASGSGATLGKQVIQFAGASENGLYLDDTRTSSGIDNAIIFGRGATYCGKIETTTAPATNYVSASDQRLKENIADADDAGSKIDAIQVRKYDWIGDGTHQEYGLVAQELQPIAPLAVSGNPESEEMMGVDYSKLVPMLVKEIQSLRSRVAELENN